MTDETKWLELLRTVGSSYNAKIRTAIPGRVLSFDVDTQTATVSVAVQSRRYDPDREEAIPYQPAPIANCPVQYPGGGGYSTRFPLEPGDDVLLMVCERSIDEWAATGAESSVPRDVRRFDLSDAIVIPGVRPPARPLDSFANDALEVMHDGSGMRLRIKDGSVYLGSSTVDVVALLGDLKTEISNTVNSVVTTMLGPMPLSYQPASVAALLSIQNDINSISE